ncbi:DUF4922 domain-containing protein [Parabacteroides sp. PF5-9]|uniref:DUF4922 domain-containing protein n=1 Tax=Parabacteroides sp. PF5-9 TaxID=1742404 RepID=UPI002476ABE5|nr:DUF4922 domain-containing protein [Parabacteroides sp. PF5-9]
MNHTFCVTSQQVRELFYQQLQLWPLVKERYEVLQQVHIKTLHIDDFNIKVQFNPSRILSAGAKVDRESLLKRKCFLCPENLPAEQIRLPFKEDYLILCNPYPIFPEHFTIASQKHIAQEISTHLNDFLVLAYCLKDFSLFYNGPKSGASAPDHMHFQVVTRNVMPIDIEIDTLSDKQIRLLINEDQSELYQLTNYLRNGFVIKATTAESALSLFQTVYNAFDSLPEESEPKMNVFGCYKKDKWIITIIPRRQHRPSQFFAEGDAHILSSPGAADIGGLYITPREEDFEKITPDILRDIYSQVCFSHDEIDRISTRIVKKE